MAHFTFFYSLIGSEINGDFCRKSPKNSPILFNAPDEGVRLGNLLRLWDTKTGMMPLPDCQKNVTIGAFVSTQCRHLTEGRTNPVTVIW